MPEIASIAWWAAGLIVGICIGAALSESTVKRWFGAGREQ